MFPNQHRATKATPKANSGERGAALIMAIILMTLLAGISLCALAVVSNEARVAGSDLQRTQTFYAASASMERMTNSFSGLFSRTINPTTAQLNAIAASYPSELYNEGFRFSQTLVVDDARLTQMRASEGIGNNAFPTVTVPSGPFTGLLASVAPYKLNSTATNSNDNSQVSLQREINNYLIPLFQFGMFSDTDIELHPGPPFVFNGRIHTNGNLYLSGDVTMLDKVTVANELVYDVLRNGNIKADRNVRMVVNGITVPLTMGSVNNGPNLPGAAQGGRGFFPGSPSGTDNTSWKSTSIAAAQASTNNQFGGQLLTRTTGAIPLMLPLQLGGNPTRELIKRQVAGEAALDPMLNQSRYHTKSQIRILIDDEGGAADAAGIPAGQGLALSTFNPSALDGGNALRLVGDNGSYSTTLDWKQGDTSRGLSADTVRGVRNDYSVWTSSSSSMNATASDATDSRNSSVPKGPGGAFIPPGAGIKGRILIQIVDTNGVARDVTREILSMGMTEGEPNGIVYLQRPLWAAFMQGSRDRDGGSNNLEFLTSDSTSRCVADGEINSANFSIDANAGYYNTSANNVDDDQHSSSTPYTPNNNKFARNDRTDTMGNNPPTSMNRIVPINVYNVREGWIKSSLAETDIYERGMTSVIEINMRNLARWVDGVYDTTLLKNTTAVSGNIDGSNGYILYISDRRGDRVKSELDRAGNPINMTNGLVDNEDIYGQNGTNGAVCSASVDQNGCDLGEDVNGNGVLSRDLLELPYSTGTGAGTIWSVGAGTRRTRAETVESWTNPSNYFRRAVRLFDASDLQITGAAGKLSSTKGITVSTENMVYIWGDYNTTGINAAPADGTASLNDGDYLGNQVPSSIVSDAFFPLSRTWSDSMSAYNPEGSKTSTTKRAADVGVPDTNNETSVRVAIIAGNNISALAGSPDAGNPDGESRMSGGMHNFPRFLEDWGGQRWNFVGSFCPLYRSTQALGPYNTSNGTIYSPPVRNWAFDTTFRVPAQLPPGTPLFQFIESTGFRQVIN